MGAAKCIQAGGHGPSTVTVLGCQDRYPGGLFHHPAGGPACRPGAAPGGGWGGSGVSAAAGGPSLVPAFQSEVISFSGKRQGWLSGSGTLDTLARETCL